MHHQSNSGEKKDEVLFEIRISYICVFFFNLL